MNEFLERLKQRKLVQWAIAYVAAAFALLQGIDIVAQQFGWPESARRGITLALVVGFFVALILAWYHGERGAQRVTGTELFIIGLVLAVGGALLWRFAAAAPASASKTSILPNESRIPEPAPVIPEKSIAVLPFENLSEEKSNAYFAVGIQEEILTRLAKIGDLKVISRTSTQQYQSKPGNISEIAKQLGVAHILEGSVQKAGDQVRVNVQLIHAQSDSHVWADSYDRKLTDIFPVESEIARTIAESLRAKLTGQEEQALVVKPTNNPEAYDAYLRAVSADAQSTFSVYPLEKAIGFYEQAVQLDPNFALAWARMARANIYWYWMGETTDTRLDAVKRALDRAQKLQPNSPETLLALGYYQYQVLYDYEPAKFTFGRVAKMLPGSSEIPSALGRIARREGHWNESIAYFEQALVLDPRNAELVISVADTYGSVRKFPEALKWYDRALDITPNDLDVIASKASVYQAEGNLAEAAKLLIEVDALTPSYYVVGVKVTQLILERRSSEAVRLLQIRLARFHFRAEMEKAIFQGILTFTQYVAGDNAGAKASAEQARSLLAPLCQEQPDNDFLSLYLSRAYAVLGDKNSALKEAQRAIAISPTAKDASRGPGMEENLAAIQLIFGEKRSVISTLARLLEVSYGGYLYGMPITPSFLRLDPMWDPLRADPAFQKLCEEKPH